MRGYCLKHVYSISKFATYMLGIFEFYIWSSKNQNIVFNCIKLNVLCNILNHCVREKWPTISVFSPVAAVIISSSIIDKLLYSNEMYTIQEQACKYYWTQYPSKALQCMLVKVLLPQNQNRHYNSCKFMYGCLRIRIGTTMHVSLSMVVSESDWCVLDGMTCLSADCCFYKPAHRLRMAV